MTLYPPFLTRTNPSSNTTKPHLRTMNLDACAGLSAGPLVSSNAIILSEMEPGRSSVLQWSRRSTRHLATTSMTRRIGDGCVCFLVLSLYRRACKLGERYVRRVSFSCYTANPKNNLVWYVCLRQSLLSNAFSCVDDRLKFRSKIVVQTLVNLCDVLDATRQGREVEVFASIEDLRRRTSQTGRYFPRERAYEGSLLRYLMRETRGRQYVDREID